MARVEIRPDVLRRIGEMPAFLRARVQNVVARLERWPEVSGTKPLRGSFAGHHRIRVGGEWRMIFRVTGDVVVIVKLANRKDVYEE